MEHPAVLECCKALQEQGFDVEYISVDRNCRLDTAALEDAIDDKTILVSVMHVNNEVGTVMPVNRIKEIMKAKNAPGIFHCDSVQSFGKLNLCNDADVITVSGHKIHGPKGIGAVYVGEGDELAGFHLRRRTGIGKAFRDGKCSCHRRGVWCGCGDIGDHHEGKHGSSIENT